MDETMVGVVLMLLGIFGTILGLFFNARYDKKVREAAQADAAARLAAHKDLLRRQQEHAQMKDFQVNMGRKKLERSLRRVEGDTMLG